MDMADERQLSPYVERRPTPDPTALTSQMIREASAQLRDEFRRETSAVRELLEGFVTALDDKLSTRLGGMDTALQLLQSVSDRLPSLIDTKVRNLHDLHEEKFNSIDKQFQGVTTLANQVTTSGKESLALALQAQKESAGESKSQHEKSIEKMEKQSETAMAIRDAKIDALTARVALMEGQTSGKASILQVFFGAIGAASVVGGLVWAAMK